MHEIIKVFRYSPLKSGILGDMQKKDGSKPLKCIIAVSTRWNSLVMSGKRFLHMLPATVKALKHKDIRSSILWDDNDTEIMKEITDTLEPARVATENLSNASINLLVGEGILKFLVDEIDRQKEQQASGALVENFRNALNTRLEQRRNKLLHVLEQPRFLEKQSSLGIVF